MTNVVLSFRTHVIGIEKELEIAEILQGVSTIDIITNLIAQTDASVINFEYRILNLYIVR
jgi:hypothetical protein